MTAMSNQTAKQANIAITDELSFCNTIITVYGRMIVNPTGWREAIPFIQSSKSSADVEHLDEDVTFEINT